MAEGSEHTEISDEALFSRVTRGDTAAFAAFYDRHETLLFALALRLLRDPAEAEDVLQEAAVVLWERAPLYDASQGKPVSWAITVLRHKAIDRLRALRRRHDLLDRAGAEWSVAEGWGEAGKTAWGERDSGEIVRRTLGQLPGEQRQAIELAFFGGLSQSEVAERLQQPLGTIKARIRRGMLALRDALEGAL